MSRLPSQTSPALRIVFVAMALVVNVAIGALIDALAGPDAAVLAMAHAAGGPAQALPWRWLLAL